MRRYFDALLAEAAAAEEELRAYEVTSIYFGGGTPSLAPVSGIAACLDAVRAGFPVAEDAEISLECNPATADAAKLKKLRDAGVNRLSIGVQSFHDTELKLLGRVHTAADALRAYEEARNAGFDNINLDLMAALPGQTADSLLDTVGRAIRLGPEHLSLYSLIIEPGTPFYERYAGQVPDPHYDRKRKRPSAPDPDTPALPDEDEEREMLHAARALLAEHGYEQYEISNYARQGGRPVTGYRCVQNLAYWMRQDYLGLGLGAASLLDDTRHTNTRDPRRYAEAGGNARGGLLSCIREETRRLSPQERMEEFMFLGLRLTEGVAEADFRRCFGRDIDEVYGETLRRHTAADLIVRENGRVRLTDRGQDLANTVMADFMF